MAFELWRRRSTRGGHTRFATDAEACLVEHNEAEVAIEAAGLVAGPSIMTSSRSALARVRRCQRPRRRATRSAMAIGTADLRLVVRPGPTWASVLHMHLGPPCTTFPQARRPALRSVLQPYGHRPLSGQTIHGARLFQRRWLLLKLQHRAGRAASLEQPKAALSWHLPFVRRDVFEQRCVSIVGWSMCSFGATWRKDTRLGFAHCAVLCAVHSPCVGGHDHVSLSGGRRAAAAAAAYPPLFRRHQRGVPPSGISRGLPAAGAASRC